MVVLQNNLSVTFTYICVVMQNSRVLESEHLYLRHMTIDDIDNMLKLNSNAEVMKYVGPSLLIKMTRQIE